MSQGLTPLVFAGVENGSAAVASVWINELAVKIKATTLIAFEKISRASIEWIRVIRIYVY